MDSLGWELVNFAFWLGGLALLAFYWRRGIIRGRFVAFIFFIGVALCIVDFLTYEARNGAPLVYGWWAVAVWAFRGPRNKTPAGPPAVGPASRAFQTRSHPSVPRQ